MAVGISNWNYNKAEWTINARLLISYCTILCQRPGAVDCIQSARAYSKSGKKKEKEEENGMKG